MHILLWMCVDCYACKRCLVAIDLIVARVSVRPVAIASHSGHHFNSSPFSSSTSSLTALRCAYGVLCTLYIYYTGLPLSMYSSWYVFECIYCIRKSFLSGFHMWIRGNVGSMSLWATHSHAKWKYLLAVLFLLHLCFVLGTRMCTVRCVWYGRCCCCSLLLRLHI